MKLYHLTCEVCGRPFVRKARQRRCGKKCGYTLRASGPTVLQGRKKHRTSRPVDLPSPVRGAKWLPLSRGKFALIDADVFEDVNRWNWSYHTNGHAFHGGGGTPTVLLHRYIMRAKPNEEIDHKNNRNRLDNRRSNLRKTNRFGNSHNTSKFRGSHSSRFKGVQWRTANQRGSRQGAWLVRICGHGQRHFLGYFSSERKAARAYDRAARRLHGKFARLNFPRPGEQSALR